MNVCKSNILPVLFVLIEEVLNKHPKFLYVESMPLPVLFLFGGFLNRHFKVLYDLWKKKLNLQFQSMWFWGGGSYRRGCCMAAQVASQLYSFL